MFEALASLSQVIVVPGHRQIRPRLLCCIGQLVAHFPWASLESCRLISRTLYCCWVLGLMDDRASRGSAKWKPGLVCKRNTAGGNRCRTPVQCCRGDRVFCPPLFPLLQFRGLDCGRLFQNTGKFAQWETNIDLIGHFYCVSYSEVLSFGTDWVRRL